MKVPRPSPLAVATQPETKDDARLIELGPAVVAAESIEHRKASTARHAT
jgi:hypothetical protein